MARQTVCVIAQEPSKTIRLHQVVQSLRRFDHEVKILKPRFYPQFRPRTLSGAFRYFAIMVQVLFSKADVYYVFNNPDVGFPALFKRGRLVYDVRNPWGAEVYDLTGNKFAAWVCEWIELVLTTRADIVVAANHKLAERAKAWGAKKVFLVPNYPISSFKPTISGEEMKRKNGLSGTRVALFTGNFAEVECALDLVRLFSKVVDKIPDAVLVMVGEGPLRPLMEKYVRENKLEQNIRLVHRVPRREVPNWLAAADVVVVPRKKNMRSSPYYCPESIWKVTEALWIGKPIVVGDVGGFIDTTLPIRTAPLERFHEAIAEILESPRRITSLKFSWDYSQKHLRKVLEAIA